jgi:hypothetical protein
MDWAADDVDEEVAMACLVAAVKCMRSVPGNPDSGIHDRYYSSDFVAAVKSFGPVLDAISENDPRCVLDGAQILHIMATALYVTTTRQDPESDAVSPFCVGSMPIVAFCKWVVNAESLLFPPAAPDASRKKSKRLP